MALIHSPGMEHLTKETKGTKSKSFARRAITYLPVAAKYGLRAANIADSVGLVKNPYLKSGLRLANTAAGFAAANPRLMNYAMSQLSGKSSTK